MYLEEVSYLGDSVYSWEIGTEIKQKVEKDPTMEVEI